MEIKRNVPTAVMQPATTVDEPLVRIIPHLERLESKMNGPHVSAIAESRTESEANPALNLAVLRAKPSSRRNRK